jgi:O-antigen/teichoic acid export membrane protein
LSNYVGTAIAIVKGIVLVPLYLRTLGVDVYGAFLASANVVGLLGVVDFGLTSVLSQRLAAAWGARDIALFRRLSGAAILGVPCLISIMVAASVFLAPYVPDLVNAPRHAHAGLTLAFLLTAIGAGGNLATANLITVVSAWQRAEIPAAARLVSQLMEIVVIVAGLIGGLGVVALGLASLIGAWAGFAIGLIWTALVWRAMGLACPQPNRTATIDLARTVAPMMLSRIVWQIGSNLEVALVSRLISPTVAAVYAITERILRLAQNFVTPIAGSMLSGLAHFVGEHGILATRRPARELSVLWSLIVAILLPSLLALNQDFTSLWIGRQNYGGATLNALLCAAAILGSRDYLIQTVLTSLGAIRAVALIGILEMLIRVPLMYVGLRLVGAPGLPATSSAVSIFGLVTCAWLVNRRLEIDRWDRWRFQTAGMLSVTVSYWIGIGEIFALPVARTWAALVVKAALVGCGHLIIALLLNPHGRSAARNRLENLWKH